MNYPDRSEISEEIIRAEAANLVALAAHLGYNVEIENLALRPLAMGHATPAVRIWPKRVSDAPTYATALNQDIEYLERQSI